MFLKSEYFNKTVSEAAKLLPTRDKVESLLIHSGIPVESIKLTDTGISMWDSAISYADKNDKHLDLIDSILAEYPSEELEDVKTHILDKSAFIIELSYDDYITPSELPSTAKTFLIYDQKDYDEHVEDLLLQLRILEFPPSTILLYDMHDVAAGADVKETRLKNMGNSDIVLLGITSRFFGNPKNECMPLAFAAYEMRKPTVPVLLDPCLWSRIKFLENISPLPRNGVFVSEWSKKDQALVEIVNGVKRLAGTIKGKK